MLTANGSHITSGTPPPPSSATLPYWPTWRLRTANAKRENASRSSRCVAQLDPIRLSSAWCQS